LFAFCSLHGLAKDFLIVNNGVRGSSFGPINANSALKDLHAHRVDSSCNGTVKETTCDARNLTREISLVIDLKISFNNTVG